MKLQVQQQRGLIGRQRHLCSERQAGEKRKSNQAANAKLLNPPAGAQQGAGEGRDRNFLKQAENPCHHCGETTGGSGGTKSYFLFCCSFILFLASVYAFATVRQAMCWALKVRA